MPYVLTVDQRGSRRSGDLVDDALQLLAKAVPTPRRAFERTAGDEFQGVLDNPSDTLTAALALVRHGSWSVGIGVGPVEEPLARPTRAGRGAAFIHARAALDSAKNRPHRVAVDGPNNRARDADVLLTLIAAIISRRSTAGWEAIDLVEGGRTVEEAALVLGISRQAVGQRLAVALWQQVRDARPLAERLLEEAAT